MLSAPEVVAASRNFICVRPQTYESSEEAKVLTYVFSGRKGLQNTSFALLDPDGKKISRGGRSASMVFGELEAIEAALKETAEPYSKEAKAIEALPVVRDLRLALNVAAADLRPLIVVRGEDEKKANELAMSVAKFAWSEELIGTCHYVVLFTEETVEDFTPALGVTVVEPDPYGLGGKSLVHVAADAEPKALGKALTKTVEAYEVESREYSAHVREARRRGIRWETEIPVTDTGRRRK